MTSAAAYQHGSDSQRHPGVPQGDVTHYGEHGGAILPDSLRWLWRTSAS
jgi:hypothetical protein